MKQIEINFMKNVVWEHTFYAKNRNKLDLPKKKVGVYWIFRKNIHPSFIGAGKPQGTILLYREEQARKIGGNKKNMKSDKFGSSCRGNKI